MRETSCEAVRAAVDRRGYLCGVALADRVRATNPPPPTQSPARPGEKGD